MAEAAAEHGDLALEVGAGDGDDDDHRRDQLQHRGRHVEAQGDGIDQAEDERAQDHADGALRNASAAHEGAADEEACQGDGHHAGSDVDVDGLLGLGQEAAGEGREGVGDAEADGGGEGGVNRGRAHHVGVVARGADGEAEARAQEEREEDNHENHGDEGHQELILGRQGGSLQEILRQGEDGLGLVHVQERGIAHDGDVDGIEAGVDDDAGKEALDPHAGLEQGRDEARDDARKHRGRQGEPGVAGDGNHGAHTGAEGEAAVRGQVADVQHRIAQEQGQNGQGVDETELQGGLAETKGSR